MKESAMGLRDAFRSRKGEAESTGLEDAAGGEHAEEPMRFLPRYDGRYRGRPAQADQPESTASAGWLRFAGPRAFWAPADTSEPDLESALAPGTQAWTGEYTPAGRFTVQRRFERPMIYTVLEIADGSFLARVTGPAPGETVIVRYSFVPAASSEPAASD